MDNTTINKKKHYTGLGILFLWLFTVCILLFRFYIGFEVSQYDIRYSTPVSVEEAHGITDKSPLSAYDPQINYKENNDKVLQEKHQEMQELQEKSTAMFLLVILVFLYLVFGIVGFVLLRNKKELRLRMFKNLTIINCVVLFVSLIIPFIRSLGLFH